MCAAANHRIVNDQKHSGLRLPKPASLSCRIAICLLVGGIAYAQSTPPTFDAARQGRTIPLPHLYWHFLTHQQHLDKIAAQSDRLWLGTYYQKDLGFTDVEFDEVRQAASHLNAELNQIDTRVASVIQEDRAGRRSYLNSADQMPELPPELQALQGQREKAIVSAATNLRETLGDEAAKRLDDFLQNEFALAESLQPGRSKEVGFSPPNHVTFAGDDTYVEAITIPVVSPDGSEIDIWSETFIPATAAYYYVGHVQSSFYRNGVKMYSQYGTQTQKGTGAIAEMSGALTIGDSYRVLSEHYLSPAFAITFNGANNDNPDASFDPNAQPSNSKGRRFVPNEGRPYQGARYSYLGTTSAEGTSGGPHISSLSPSAAVIGAIGILKIYGSNLIAPFAFQSSPVISGSGISTTTLRQSENEIDLEYTLSKSATVGIHTVTVITGLGTSNSAAFSLIAPSRTSASGPGDTSAVAVNSPNSVATATIAHEPQNNSAKRLLAPDSLPAATIYYFNNTIDPASPVNVTVGQLVSLTTTVQIPEGTWIASNTWVLGGQNTAIVNLNGSLSGETVTAWSPPNTTNTAFYWVGNGAVQSTIYQVSYSYCLNTGPPCSAVATVEFNVAGPTGVTVTPNAQSVNVYQGPFRAQLAFQPPPPTTLPGISFLAQLPPVNGNRGSYQWVQILTTDVSQYISNVGVQRCTTFANPSDSTELDGTYPYGFLPNGDPTGTVTTTNVLDDTASDSPRQDMLQGFGEWQRSFAAAMYTRWIPNADPLCNATTVPCTIPIPLGSEAWSFCGDAINTQASQNNGTSWQLSCSQNSTAGTITFVQSDPMPSNNFGYLTWPGVEPLDSGCATY